MKTPAGRFARGGAARGTGSLLALSLALAVLGLYFIFGEHGRRHVVAGLLMLFCAMVALGLGRGRRRQ